MHTKIWTENPKIPLGRCRRRCKGNIKMDLKERGCEGVNWILHSSGSR